MGYDAFVPCNCWEKGKIKKEPPFPASEIFRDEYGNLDCKLISDELYKNNKDEYWQLMHKFDDWVDSACEHDFGWLANERIANIWAMSWLRECVQKLDEGDLPILSTMLPTSNDGMFPVGKAEAALSDLEKFENKLDNAHTYELFSTTDNRVIYLDSINESSGFYMYESPFMTFYDEKPAKFVVQKDNQECFTARRFKQSFDVNRNSSLKYKLTELDFNSGKETNNIFYIDRYLSFGGYENAEFIVRETNNWLIEIQIDILRRLLNASLETGNPINWC